jgi:hypothetical protein
MQRFMREEGVARRFLAWSSDVVGNARIELR